MHVIYVSDSHILWRYPMSHLSSQPPEIAAENLSQSPRSAGSAWAREKRFADVLGRRMAYIERGVGHPIVFLHGNPTSSFLWRGVLPHVEASRRRLIAPDLIGMGDSDKIPAGAEPDRYRFASYARYLDAFIDEVVGTEPLTLVLHDWGGALGFDWAYRHQQPVRAIAYMETFVAPLTLEDLPESFHPTLKAVRSSAGEALVLDENMFIEKMLPGVTQRALSADEMAEYRRPIRRGRRRSLADIAVAARSAAVGRAGGCPRSDCRLLLMAENSVAAEAFYRRGARCIHHGPNKETDEQLP